MANGIIIYIEHLKGIISDISFEILGAARKIADDTGMTLYAVLAGKTVDSLLPGLGKADLVITIEDDSLEMPNPEAIADILNDVGSAKGITLFMVGGTNVSSGIGAILSSKQKIPLINLCKNVRHENGCILATNQLFGGKIFSEIKIEDSKGVFCIYPGSYKSEAGKSDKFPQTEKFDYKPKVSKIKFNKIIEPDLSDVDISKEDILVSVGRGIGNKDNISLAEELVAVLGGAVSASRPVIDQGWLPLNRQVGKSGMIVKPKLYLALGISGAPEHVEGMKDSSLIVAINKDPAAPIFNFAHYGLCADIEDIVPVLTESIRNKKG
ncbi:MAG: electron transfer flavoprotein subunit alpha/FixB family protein [Bacteroidota bacterium]